MKKSIKIIALILLLIIAYWATVIIIGTTTNYTPNDKEVISQLEGDFFIADSTVYSVLIWNIGYAGLGGNMDFFYDGGKGVRDTETNVRENLYNITGFLQQNDTVDFMLLQEVDEYAKRSYGINMVDHLNMSLPEHFPFFAFNYKVKYVPLPFTKPMGKVEAGLLTLSKHIPVETSRYSFPGNYSWPTSVFMLDRCFLASTYKLSSGKEFTLINTHNSAYDDGSLRQQQMQFLNDYLTPMSDNGNPFIVGGDWNQSPANFTYTYTSYNFDSINFVKVEQDFLQTGWSFIYDQTSPTNRRLQEPFNKETTKTTIIDYFLTSPQIEIISCKTIDLEFVHSDHNPVIISFRL